MKLTTKFAKKQPGGGETCSTAYMLKEAPDAVFQNFFHQSKVNFLSTVYIITEVILSYILVSSTAKHSPLIHGVNRRRNVSN